MMEYHAAIKWNEKIVIDYWRNVYKKYFRQKNRLLYSMIL